MLNPNKAFKGRHRSNPSECNIEELAGMMITLGQKHVLTGFTMREGVRWRDLCMSTIGKHKNMSDCTFYEAALCVQKTRSWKYKKGDETR